MVKLINDLLEMLNNSEFHKQESCQEQQFKKGLFQQMAKSEWDYKEISDLFFIKTNQLQEVTQIGVGSHSVYVLLLLVNE